MNTQESFSWQDISTGNALANLPEFERVLILSNGLQSATQNSTNEKNVAGQRFTLQSPAFEKHQNRKQLLSLLKNQYPNTNWQSLGIKSKGYWGFKASMRTRIRELANVKNNDFNPFREHNFIRCGARKGGGFLHGYADGSLRLQVATCSETTACPECADAKAKEIARKTFEYLQAIAEANNLKRMWFFVFTLPERHEDKPKKGTETRKKLLNGLKKVLRVAFGLKTRDLLASYCSVHAVGDSDLFRTRNHFHIGVLPCAIHRKKGGIHEYRNVDPKGLVDLDNIRKLWVKACCEAGIYTKLEESNFKAEYVEIPDQWGKMRHRINYDLRGFGSDFMQSAIYHSSGMACLESAKNSYQVKTIEDIAKRWLWVRKQRDYRPWGLLAKKDTYANLLNIEKILDIPPEQESVKDVIVQRDIGRAYSVEKKRVEWQEITVVTDSSGNIISGWEFGLFGERERWWPKNKPRPKPRVPIPEIIEEPDAPIVDLTTTEIQLNIF